MNKQAPGPKGLPLIGNYFGLRHNILSLMVKSREQYGDVVRFRLGPRVIHVVNHPDLVRQVLVSRRDNYDKTARSSKQIKHLAGMSLLVSNDEDWQIKRRLLQPAFKINMVATYFDLMQELAEASRASVQDQQVVDISSLMMHLTYRIVGMALMSNDLSNTSDEVEHAMSITLQHLYKRINSLSLPLCIPTPSNMIFRHERRRLRDIVTDILNRRDDKKNTHDLLSELVTAKNSERDHRLDSVWLRDEVVTLLLAGHETTANALSFCLYLLAKHPQIQQRLYAEIHNSFGSGRLKIEDLDKLTFCNQVLQEALRLYPPIWAMERHVKQGDQLNGYDIPAGSTLFVSIFAMHRHTDFWQDAETFDPDRFINQPSHRAYLPFGLGPRMCLGMNFAIQEAMIILVTMLQRFELIHVMDTDIELEPGITLRVRGRLPIQLRAR